MIEELSIFYIPDHMNMDEYGLSIGKLIHVSPAEALLHPHEDVRKRAKEMLDNPEQHRTFIKWKA